MKLTAKQIEAITSLPGPKRYQHFIKIIADVEEVWGLYQNGWALAETEDGTQVFPLWPAKEYAELCAKGEWSDYEARPFSLDELINDLLPSLKDDRVLAGVFYTPSDNGLTPEIEKFAEDIINELEKY